MLFSLSFSLISATISGKTARDTFFLNQFDISYLPLMFVASAIAVGIFVPLYSRLLKKKGPYNTLLITGAISATSLAVIQFTIIRWMVPILYVWMEVVATVLAFQIWTIAADLFDSRQAKRLYGILAAGGSISFLFIGLWLKPFIAKFGSGSILQLTILFILLAMGLSFSIRKLPNRSGARTDRPIKATNDKESLFTPYLKSVALMTIMIGIVTTIVDFQFKSTAGSTITDADALAVFFGKFYAIAGLASLCIQLFLTGRLLSKFGILAGLLILPFSMVVGFSMILIHPILLSALVGKFAEQTFELTLHQPTIQLLWLPVKKWQRQFGKPLIDGTIRTSVEGFTGFLTFFIIKIASATLLTFVAIGASLLWILSAFYVRKGYIQTLNEALQARRLNFEDLHIDSLNHAMVETIDKSLKEGDVFEQLFVLELIQSVAPDPWKKTLESLMVSADNHVRKNILSYAGDLFEEQLILDLIREPFLDAIELCGKRKIPGAIPILQELIDHENEEIQMAAAGTLLLISEGSQEKPNMLLFKAINSNDPQKIMLGIKYAFSNASILSNEKMVDFLQHDNSQIRRAAIESITDNPDEEYLPFLIGNLGSPKTAMVAKNALVYYNNPMILESIHMLMENPPLSVDLKRGIISTLETIPMETSHQLLFTFFDPQSLGLYEQAVDSMLIVAKKQPLSKSGKKNVKSSIKFLAKRIYSLHQCALLLKNDKTATLILDYIRSETHAAQPILIKLGALHNPHLPVSQCLKSLRSNDPQQISYGLELLETIFTREEREIVTPLIENRSLVERVQIGHKIFKSIKRDINSYLEQFLYSRSPWVSAIALDCLIKSERTPKHPVQWDKITLSQFHGEIIQRAGKTEFHWIGTLPDKLRKFPQSNTMYTTLEKTILLKSVPLFRSIPAEVISSIAQIAEEIPVKEGTLLFHEGDDGDGMYVIVDGKVDVHKGDKKIAVLTKWDCLGEMALLDEEPRSADATVSEEGILLRISQESFSELMRQHPDIMHSLLKILTGRLRNVI